MSANIEDFKINQEDIRTQSLADLFPTGKVFDCVNIERSTMRSLLKGLSQEVGRCEGQISALARDYIPNNTTSFLEEWEKFVGIPEGCFDLEFTDLERRINILIKLGYLNLQVEQDYRDLADILNVEIVSFDNSVYGTITITIVDLVPDTFDLLFDPVLNPTYGAFIFGSKTDTLYQCLIQTYKPAFINVVFVEQQQ